MPWNEARRTSGSKSSFPSEARVARHRLDIDGIVVIGRGDAQGRLPAQALQRLERLVADRRRRRRAILGIERNDENAVAALFLQRFEPLGDRRLAVAHRPVDLDASLARPGRQRVPEPFRLGAGDRFQRAFVAFAVPDRSIVAPPDGWPSRQDDEVEDRPPDEPGRLDDAPVGQEFLEVAAHRPVVGRLGRAEIDQQRADAPAPDRGMALRAPRGAKGVGRVRRVHDPRFVDAMAPGVKPE